MQNRNHDGSIDMNAFAAILSLAPEVRGRSLSAFSGVNRLGGESVEKARAGMMTQDWDPWGAENQ